jgi:hypothetical protein
LHSTESGGGHVSFGWDGRSHSWELNGWVDPFPRLEDYIAENQKWRSGTSYVLDDGPEWNAKFRHNLETAYDNHAVGISGLFGYQYDLFQNNCGHAFGRAINEMGGLPVNNCMLPSCHQKYIESNLGHYIKSKTVHEVIVPTPSGHPTIDTDHWH